MQHPMCEAWYIRSLLNTLNVYRGNINLKETELNDRIHTKFGVKKSRNIWLFGDLIYKAKVWYSSCISIYIL